jgi:hypothetical protein
MTAQETMTLREAARHFGVTQEAVRAAAALAGVQLHEIRRMRVLIGDDIEKVRQVITTYGGENARIRYLRYLFAQLNALLQQKGLTPRAASKLLNVSIVQKYDRSTGMPLVGIKTLERVIEELQKLPDAVDSAKEIVPVYAGYTELFIAEDTEGRKHLVMRATDIDKPVRLIGLYDREADAIRYALSRIKDDPEVPASASASASA